MMTNSFCHRKHWKKHRDLPFVTWAECHKQLLFKHHTLRPTQKRETHLSLQRRFFTFPSKRNAKIEWQWYPPSACHFWHCTGHQNRKWKSSQSLGKKLFFFKRHGSLKKHLNKLNPTWINWFQLVCSYIKTKNQQMFFWKRKRKLLLSPSLPVSLEISSSSSFGWTNLVSVAARRARSIWITMATTKVSGLLSWIRATSTLASLCREETFTLTEVTLVWAVYLCCQFWNGIRMEWQKRKPNESKHWPKKWKKSPLLCGPFLGYDHHLGENRIGKVHDPGIWPNWLEEFPPKQTGPVRLRHQCSLPDLNQNDL